MKSVPLVGALLVLYIYPAPGHAQDLTPHQEAAGQINSCLTLADQQITVLSERLRELKTQRQRLGTLEDALSKVTLQKSNLEAELLNRNVKDVAATAELGYALKDAQRTSKAYREETERLRQDVIRLTQSVSTASADQDQLANLEKKHAEAVRQLESERNAIESLKRTLSSSDAKVASNNKELTTLCERLRQAEDSAEQLQPLRDQIESSKQSLASAEEARDRQVEQTAALTERLKKAQTELIAYKDTQDQQRTQLETLRNQHSEDVRKADEEIASLKELLAKANTDHADNRAALTNQLAEATKTAEETQTAHTAIMNERAAKDAKISELEKALEDERTKAERAAKLQEEIAIATANERKLNQALEKAKQEQANLLTNQQTRDTKILKELEVQRTKAARADELKQKLTIALAKQREIASELKKAQAERSITLNNQSAQDKQLADALKALEAERVKVSQASELEKELAGLRANVSEDQAAFAKLQETSKAAEARITSLTLVESKTVNAAKQAQADLQKRVEAKDAELAELRKGLTEKENAWQQERIAFQAKQKANQEQITAARRNESVMQQDFLRIDPIRYALNSSQIDDEQARVLAQAQKILKVYPKASFEISGHTCTLGSDERNQALSEQRAKRLLDFLASSGVALEQLSSAGYGESKPIADNATDAGRRQNRRVEIRVKSADGETLLNTEDRQ